MLTNGEKKLLKMAQRELGMADAEYRDAIAMATQLPDCRSSTDARLTSEHVDRLMKYFEAIFWNNRGTLHHQSQVFRSPGYWAGKNQKGNTSRDRHVADQIDAEIEQLQLRLVKIGYNPEYFRAIRRRVCENETDPTVNDLIAYKSALERTIKSKERSQPPVDQPF